MAENIIEFEHTVSEILKVYIGGGRLAKRENLHTEWPDDNDLDIGQTFNIFPSPSPSTGLSSCDYLFFY